MSEWDFRKVSGAGSLHPTCTALYATGKAAAFEPSEDYEGRENTLMVCIGPILQYLVPTPIFLVLNSVAHIRYDATTVDEMLQALHTRVSHFNPSINKELQNNQPLASYIMLDC